MTQIILEILVFPRNNSKSKNVRTHLDFLQTFSDRKIILL